MKQILLLITASFLLLILFISSSGGRDDNRANAPGDMGYCSACHSGASTNGDINLTGAPTTYVAGQTYNMTLEINDINAIEGGFQIVATDGSSNAQVGVFTAGAGQRINNTSRLVQSTPKAFSNNIVSWPIVWTAPESKTPPANIKFYFAGNAANDNGSTSGDATYAGFSGLIPLPVELISFSATQQKGGVILNWATASQRDFSHFSIEKSTDGIAFASIGEILGEATTAINQRYSFTDNNASFLTTYYRLKSVDLDGRFELSKILSVQSKGQHLLSVFPNPIQHSDRLNVSSERFQNNEIEIAIFDLNGRLVTQDKIKSNDNLLQIELAKWSIKSGNYFASFAVQGKFIGKTQLKIK